MHLTFNDWRDSESRLRQTASISFLFSHFASLFGKVWYQNRQPNGSYSDFNASRILTFDQLPLTQFDVATWLFVQNPEL